MVDNKPLLLALKENAWRLSFVPPMYSVLFQNAGVPHKPPKIPGSHSTICASPFALKWPMESRLTRYSDPCLPICTNKC